MRSTPGWVFLTFHVVHSLTVIVFVPKVAQNGESGSYNLYDDGDDGGNIPYHAGRNVSGSWRNLKVQ